MMITQKVNALVLAAGKGSRSGLTYNKCLYKIEGRSIISSIIEKFAFLDSKSVIVINSGDKDLFQENLKDNLNRIEFVFQDNPLGMGNAVLKFKSSSVYLDSEHLLLIWGDLPFIEEATIKEMVTRHLEDGNDFSFVSADSDEAYTRVIRNADGQVIDLIETHEESLNLKSGERDIGLFIFKTKKILEMLEKDLDGKVGKRTNEHSFLYIIKHLVKAKMNVSAYKIAKSDELISLNTQDDIELIKSLKS